MQIVIASGKGGTGKTTVSSNLGYVLSQSRTITLADCDVEEPNLGIFFPCVPETHPVHVIIPKVHESQCMHCGACGEFCRFGALTVLKDRYYSSPSSVIPVGDVSGSVRMMHWRKILHMLVKYKPVIFLIHSPSSVES